MIINVFESSVRPGGYTSQKEHYEDRNGHQNDFSSDFPLIPSLRAFDQPCQFLCVINGVETEDYC